MESMRKAGQTLRRNSRKKTEPNAHPQQQPHHPQQQMPQPPPPPPAVRKPTPDEAALTAKNYRMAKELSELRVRHRDECKTVTKLTMENMRLASRYRDAMSHVGHLREQLTLVEQRLATSGKPRVEVPQSPPSTVAPTTGSTTTSSDDLRLLTSTSAASSSSSTHSNEEAVLTSAPVDSDDYIEDMESSLLMGPGEENPDENDGNAENDGQQNSSTNRNAKENVDDRPLSPNTNETVREAPGGLFPATASPKLVPGYNNSSNKRYNPDESYPADITQRKPASMAPRLDLLEPQEEGQPIVAPKLQQHLQVQAPLTEQQQPEKIAISSMDAFVASFDTDFPESFTPESATTASPQNSVKSESYNPFFPSPPKTTVAVRKEEPPVQRKVPDAAPSTSPTLGTKTMVPQSDDGSSRSARSTRASDPPGKDRTSLRAAAAAKKILAAKSAAAVNNNNSSSSSSSLLKATTNSPPTARKSPASASAPPPPPPPAATGKTAHHPRRSPVPASKPVVNAGTLSPQQQQQISLGTKAKKSPVRTSMPLVNPGEPPAPAASPALSTSSKSSKNSLPVGRSPLLSTTTTNAVGSPRTPEKATMTTTTTTATHTAKSYQSPSPSNRSPTLASGSTAGSTDPGRPQKQGFDSARAKYQRALAISKARKSSASPIPTSSASSAHSVVVSPLYSPPTTATTTTATSAPKNSRREDDEDPPRIGRSSASSLYHARIAAAEDDGDIPMHTSIQSSRQQARAYTKDESVY